MSSDTIDVFANELPLKGFSAKILNGDVFHVRNCLNKPGLFDALEKASYEGIKNCLGEDIASKAREIGIEKIHTLVAAIDIPELTDSVYDAVTPISLDFLKRFLSEILGESDSFYFEQKPNVRFHIPHDNAEQYSKDFKEFAKRRGDGKITPHNPHRDSWVDCPNNLINIWIALGPVKTGNSLTIYPEAYNRDIRKSGPLY